MSMSEAEISRHTSHFVRVEFNQAKGEPVALFQLGSSVLARCPEPVQLVPKTGKQVDAEILEIFRSAKGSGSKEHSEITSANLRELSAARDALNRGMSPAI
jgi:hypothetical protein